jgi:hypothetical protein
LKNTALHAWKENRALFFFRKAPKNICN